jgi:hypothetical protein
MRRIVCTLAVRRGGRDGFPFVLVAIRPDLHGAEASRAAISFAKNGIVQNLGESGSCVRLTSRRACQLLALLSIPEPSHDEIDVMAASLRGSLASLSTRLKTLVDALEVRLRHV